MSEQDKQDLPRTLKGNICRCTGYRSIDDAVHGRINVEEGHQGVGHSTGALAGPAVVTGTVRYTMDIDPADLPAPLLYAVIVRSPHPHARILNVRTDRAMDEPAVIRVFTHLDAPALRFSSGQHELVADDPYDTRVLDDVVRFIGQRVALVVATSARAAQRGAALIDVDYGLLRGVSSWHQACSASDQGRRPGDSHPAGWAVATATPMSGWPRQLVSVG
jgi:putative selenate reductase molybdopterin-binding subunit